MKRNTCSRICLPLVALVFMLIPSSQINAQVATTSFQLNVSDNIPVPRTGFTDQVQFTGSIHVLAQCRFIPNQPCKVEVNLDNFQGWGTSGTQYIATGSAWQSFIFSASNPLHTFAFDLIPQDPMIPGNPCRITLGIVNSELGLVTYFASMEVLAGGGGD